MSDTIHRRLDAPLDLADWEPVDGFAIVTCKVDVGRGFWEDRTYELQRGDGVWLIYFDGGHGKIRRDSWPYVVGWLCCMRPIDIELVTTK